MDLDLYNKLMTIFREQKFKTNYTTENMYSQTSTIAPPMVDDTPLPQISFAEVLEHARVKIKKKKKKQNTRKRYKKQRKRR